jgi:hypothetical protein
LKKAAITVRNKMAMLQNIRSIERRIATGIQSKGDNLKNSSKPLS